MAYKELIKNFDNIRDYMRDFYVYGFKSRDEYTKKSARSYDNERRRIESWLGTYMDSGRSSAGKNQFLSIDSRESRHNPLYKAWKTKTFTDRGIALHFWLFDILPDASVYLSLNEIVERLDEYRMQFDESKPFDESTVRKKLKEYVEEGIIVTEKRGRTVFYRRADDCGVIDPHVLDLASEIMPCGVIGSFLLDKAEPHQECFAFKHHYITGTMDSEILCQLLEAMQAKCSVIMQTTNRKHDRMWENRVIPLRIMISVQNGRQYLMAYTPKDDGITAFRLDNIISVRMGAVSEQFDERRRELDEMLPHMWGISTQSRSGRHTNMKHVSFTVVYGDDESYIPKRLEREKRCGTVEHLDEHHSRFTAEVYDASELISWMRTFICRITEVEFSDEKLERRFKKDIRDMYKLYGIEGDSIENAGMEGSEIERAAMEGGDADAV